jgi:putative zinc finger/helix-turn-helix YgiT family protein
MTHDASALVGQNRPFPWPCADCGAHEVYPQAIDYTTTVKHDGDAYTIHIPDLELPMCRKCGEQLFSADADDRVHAVLREQAGLLAPENIRKERERLRITQQELAEHLGVSSETVARWEAGGIIQSRALDNLLRVFFESEEARQLLRKRLGLLARQAG